MAKTPEGPEGRFERLAEEIERRPKLDVDVMILTTQDVRRQLKIIAAVTRETMKEVLVRLVAVELKRVAPEVKL
jgi:F420-0:gamma-glutamyl ligase-like protein